MEYTTPNPCIGSSGMQIVLLNDHRTMFMYKQISSTCSHKLQENQKHHIQSHCFKANLDDTTL